MVKQMSIEDFDVKLLCRVLGVSRSGYYAWLKRPISEREKQNQQITTKVIEIHKDSRGTYGVPRVTRKLREVGFNCGKNRISSVMRKADIFGVAKKRFRVRTTDSRHDFPIAKRIVQTENPKPLPIKPNQCWASDITYIATDEGWLYLAVFLDLFSRKIVGFSTKDNLKLDPRNYLLRTIKLCAEGKAPQTPFEFAKSLRQ